MVYHEIVLLSNGHYSFSLINSLVRARVRSSPLHPIHPFHNQAFFRSYNTFRDIHLFNLGLNTEIPYYIDNFGRYRIYLNTQTWCCYNLHNEVMYILSSDEAFNAWSSDFNTRRIEDRYKLITTNNIWRNRSESDFNRLNVSRLVLRQIINHSYVEQLKEIKTSLYMDAFRRSPSAYNYFNFRYKS